MLKILKHGVNGVTGHIEVDVLILEQVGNATVEGLKETHGIAAHELQEKFNGDPTEWLKGIHRTMLKQHEARKISTTALQALHGLTLIEDEEANGNQSSLGGNKVQR